ncbi:FtsH protease activity modulator HflK [bacterium]|nr:FtsH protease activity modulator HflK [bacterium]
MNEIGSIIKTTLKQFKNYTKVLLILSIIIYITTGIYTVKQNEIAIVRRFGKIISSNVKPGISYSLPFPIDKVDKIEIKKVQTLVIDHFSELPEINSEADMFMKKTDLRNYAITGDNNTINLTMILKYVVADPKNYLINFINVDSVIQAISQNEILSYLSVEPIQEVLVTNRSEMNFTLRNNIQKKINESKLGVEINSIEIKNISPPSIILHYFNDVINAGIDKEKTIKEAFGYKTKVLSQARIRAMELDSEAQIYSKERISKAEGECKTFNLLLEEYKKSPISVKRRHYLDMLNEIYPSLERSYIVDSKKRVHYKIVD